MSYAIKDIFYTIQGEGANAGRPAVFIRMAGCNLWSGRPQDRDKGAGACAQWCDTDFFKGEKLEVQDIYNRVRHLWPTKSDPLVVITGGEPMLQLHKDSLLLTLLNEEDIEISMETNGTIDSTAYEEIEHVCLSPKRGTTIAKSALLNAQELKVVLPGVNPVMSSDPGWREDELLALASKANAGWLFVQPQDPMVNPMTVGSTHLHLLQTENVALKDTVYDRHVKECVEFVKKHPEWRISMQTHKYMNVP